MFTLTDTTAVVTTAESLQEIKAKLAQMREGVITADKTAFLKAEDKYYTALRAARATYDAAVVAVQRDQNTRRQKFEAAKKTAEGKESVAVAATTADKKYRAAENAAKRALDAALAHAADEGENGENELSGVIQMVDDIRANAQTLGGTTDADETFMVNALAEAKNFSEQQKALATLIERSAQEKYDTAIAAATQERDQLIATAHATAEAESNAAREALAEMEVEIDKAESSDENLFTSLLTERESAIATAKALFAEECETHSTGKELVERERGERRAAKAAARDARRRVAESKRLAQEKRANELIIRLAHMVRGDDLKVIEQAAKRDIADDKIRERVTLAIQGRKEYAEGMMMVLEMFEHLPPAGFYTITPNLGVIFNSDLAIVAAWRDDGEYLTRVEPNCVPGFKGGYAKSKKQIFNPAQITRELKAKK